MARTVDERVRDRTLLGLVEQALAQPPTDRGAWLAERCPPELLKQACQLLHAAEQVPVYEAPNLALLIGRRPLQGSGLS